MKNKNLWKFLIAGVLLLGLIAASRFLPINAWMKMFTEWVKNHGTLGVILFMLSYAIGAVLFMPASPFLLAAGIAFGFTRGVLVALGGGALGAALSFLISRHWARQLVEKRLSKNEKLKAFDAVVAQGGWKVVLLLRLVPLFPFPVGNYFFGLTRVGFWPFLAATLLGIVPGTMLYTQLGSTIGDVALNKGGRARTTQEYVMLGLGMIATIIVIAYITKIARKTLKQIEERTQATGN